MYLVSLLVVSHLRGRSVLQLISYPMHTKILSGHLISADITFQAVTGMALSKESTVLCPGVHAAGLRVRVACYSEPEIHCFLLPSSMTSLFSFLSPVKIQLWLPVILTQPQTRPSVM